MMTAMPTTSTMEDLQNYFSCVAADKTMRCRRAPVSSSSSLVSSWVTMPKVETKWEKVRKKPIRFGEKPTYKLRLPDDHNNKQFMSFGSVLFETFDAFHFRDVLIWLNDTVISPQTNILWC